MKVVVKELSEDVGTMIYIECECGKEEKIFLENIMEYDADDEEEQQYN